MFDQCEAETVRTSMNRRIAIELKKKKMNGMRNIRRNDSVCSFDADADRNTF